MDLNTLWFVLIGVLFTGYFVLEGFDFGVGALAPFLGKTDSERRMVINTIGPHWDANEVWLLTAGGAIFAAFPGWYATLFSGFYLALFVLLAVLIVRGVALEFRSKREDAAWRKRWDWALSITSILAPVLLGVAFANLLEGVPIDGSQNFVGTFWDLFSPFSVLAGLMVLSGFLYHGAMFLKIKTSDPIMGRADKLGKTLWITTMVLALVVVGFVLFSPTMNSGKGALPTIIALLGFVAVAISGIVNTRKDSSLPFWLTTLSIVFLSAAFFMYMFPNVMISSLDPNYHLTIYNVASSAKTLQIMSLVAAFGVPIVLLYQGWSYWIFRKRLTEKPSDLHY